MHFLLSFPLHPLFDFIRGGLVGFEVQAGPQAAPHPPGTRCLGSTAPTAPQHPWPGLPPTLALSSIQNQAIIHN